MKKIKQWFKKIFTQRSTKTATKSKAIEPQSSHGLYEDGSYVPDWIYDGHYDCGDK